MQRALRILSYNLHKGRSSLLRRNILPSVKRAIETVNPDLVFLQEIRGDLHRVHASGEHQTQVEYLSCEERPHVAYGGNLFRRTRHHGNAILSRFPIVASENIDISAHASERRGILHAVIEMPGSAHREVHALCLHLGLLEHWRKRQMDALSDRIRHAVPARAPLIVAGDFNDWRERAADYLADHLHLKEAHLEIHGDHARTFPSRMPVLKLDRVYTRGFRIAHAESLDGPPWTRLSDHVPVLLEIRLA